jgi:hypothetical protein
LSDVAIGISRENAKRLGADVDICSVDAEKMKREEKAYKPIPVITDFADANGNDCMKEMVKANYRRIKEEVKQIVADELERIAGDENLKHLLQQK